MILLTVVACAAGCVTTQAPAASKPGGAPHGDASADATVGDPTPGEPFELHPDDRKLTLVFEGGKTPCSGPKRATEHGRYAVDFAKKVVRLDMTDACGGRVVKSAMFLPAARRDLAALVAATSSESRVFGDDAVVKHAMAITRADGHVVRMGTGQLDPNDGHAPRIRAFLNTLLF